MDVSASTRARALERDRRRLLRQVEAMLETPMVVLGFAWLALLVVELVRGASPVLERLGDVIWATFLVDFGIKLTIAPRKVDFLRGNLLTIVSLALPALRVFRLVRVLRLSRAARAVRGARLVRVVGSTNRAMRALRSLVRRRGLGYVVALTGLVTFAGAAGMYAFESGVPGRPFPDYGTAVWWTAMLLTTMGSEYWPKTPEGRILCLLLATYAFAVFGYITAFLASFFVDRDAASPEAAAASAADVEALRMEVRALRRALERAGPLPTPES